MKLATNKEVVDRLRLVCEDDPANVAAVDRALVAATQHIAGEIRTEFDRRTVRDVWFIDRDQFAHSPRRLDLYQSQAFLDFIEPTEIRIACSVDDLDDAQSVVAAQDVTFKFQRGHRGVFQLFGSPLIGHLHAFGHPSHGFRGRDAIAGEFYVRLEYTAGFRSKPDEGGQLAKVYDQKRVPDWLHEAAIQMAVEIYVLDGEGDSAQRSSSGRQSGVKRKVGQYLATAENLLAPNIRAIPQAQRPMFSEEVD